MKSLDKYKKGDMTPEELEEFTDVFMRAKFDNDRKTRWENTLQTSFKVDRERVRGSKIIPQRRLISYLAIAAAAVLLFTVIRPAFLATTTTYAQLTDQFISQDFYENLSGIKGDQDTDQLNLRAVYAYNQKDFTTAISLYQQLIERGAANDEQYFFLGLSYFYDRQYATAIKYLDTTSEIYPDSKFKQETNWFLALAYLKNGELEKGKVILRSIQSGMWNHDKAQQLLDTFK